MTLSGKEMWIWKVDSCEGGNVSAIVAKAKLKGISRLNIKAQEGATGYNSSKIVQLVDSLRSAGLQVGIWAFLYGSSVNYAKSEAQKSAQLISTLSPDVFCFDVEGPYKRTGSDQWARSYMDNLIPAVPAGTKFAMTSYRYPTLHPEIPWNTFLAGCAYHMPQVYWQGSHNPAFQLEKSYNELMALKKLPFYPVGSAYCEHGWCATPADITQFANKAIEMKMSSYGFWSWDYAVNNMPDVWKAIVDAPNPGGVPPVIPPPVVTDPGWFSVVTNQPLNVRSGPGLNYPVLFVNPKDKTLLVYGVKVFSDYTWIKISPTKKEWCALTKNTTVFAQ